MNEDSNHLQREVERLNYIIDLLIKENQQLRSVLPESLLPNYPRNPVTQEFLKENILTWLVSSNAKQGDALNQFVSSNQQKGFNIDELISSNLEEGDVSNNLLSSNPENGYAQNEPVSFNLKKEALSNEAILSNQQKEITSNKPVELTQEKESEAKQVNVVAALKVLRTDNVTASRTSVKNSLKLLQHLANNPQNNTRQLSKATGMSESGLSKRLSALRKQGYVTKLKVRHYVLTQKALDVLDL